MPELLSGPHIHESLPSPGLAERRRLMKTSQFTEELETYGKSLAHAAHAHFEAIHEYLPEYLEIDPFLSRPLLLKLIDAAFRHARVGGILVLVSRAYANQLIISLHIENTIIPEAETSALLNELIAANRGSLGSTVKTVPTPRGTRQTAYGPDGKVVIDLDEVHGTTFEFRLDLPVVSRLDWLMAGT